MRTPFVLLCSVLMSCVSAGEDNGDQSGAADTIQTPSPSTENWVVLVERNSGTDTWTQTCSGTLLKADLVLTARHCLCLDTSTNGCSAGNYEASALRVRVGQSTSSFASVTIGVQSIVPLISDARLAYVGTDVALVRLSANAAVTTFPTVARFDGMHDDERLSLTAWPVPDAGTVRFTRAVLNNKGGVLIKSTHDTQLCLNRGVQNATSGAPLYRDNRILAIVASANDSSCRTLFSGWRGSATFFTSTFDSDPTDPIRNAMLEAWTILQAQLAR